MGNLMKKKREITMAAMKQTDLPARYQRVQYIENTSTAYIITDVFPSETLGFDCDFMPFGIYTNQTNQFSCIFGGRKASTNNDFQLTTWTNFVQIDGTYYPANNGCLRDGNQVNAHMIGQNVRQLAQLRNKVYTGPDGVVVNVSAYSWASDRRPIYLFALNNNGSPVQQGPGCRIYSMKFYDGNNVIREYIPCYRKSDNEVGMYEKYTRQFLTNQGSGSFTKGPDAYELPTGYTQLDYISNPNGAYINTGMNVNNSCKITLTLETETSNSNHVQYGWRRSGTYKNPYQLYVNSNYDSISGSVVRLIIIGHDITTPTAIGSTTCFEFGTRTTLIMDAPNNSVTVNGTAASFTYNFSSGKAFDSNGSSAYTPCIFTFNAAGTPNTSVIDTGMKLYEYKVEQGGHTLQHLIPCKNSSDVYGVYDLVSKTFIGSANGQVFTGA